MLRIRDLSLEKRILTTNFLMVFIPALLLFRDGKVVGTSVGYVAKPELEAFLSGR